ncbi:hypothetical protein FIBSPDRAFT_955838 [Athelia psychrophila]|uniref:DUF6533 domain-containing protein n=1 Tax=Athelia psychrophila TaxID=1759441 RepID=A0A166HHQ8_9AGAM|nr:hypothetical protein FIBSPDRAFT_955838 [Fibularhizoctonia sp. CBS 109695]
MSSSTSLDCLPTLEAELFDLRLEAYIFTSCFVAYAYDWLLSISEESEILSKRGLSWSIALYFSSRIGEFLHQVLLAVYTLASFKSCNFLKSFFIVLSMLSVISIASTSFLFLLRVRAVYLGSKYIMVVFGSLWLCTMVLLILSNAGIQVGHPSGSQYCTVVSIAYFPLPSISSFVNDTLIFLAISFRLAANSTTEKTWRSWALSAVKGEGLLRLSRSLLLSGQLYYVATMVFFFVHLFVMESPLLSNILHYSLANAYIAFTNIMACRIFRGITLGMMEDNPTTWNTARIGAALESRTRAPRRVAAIAL